MLFWKKEVQELTKKTAYSRSDVNLLIYFGSILSFAAFNIFATLKQNPDLIYYSSIFSLYFQFTFAHLSTMILMNLCLEPNSNARRFFKTKTMQFLGRISLSLYLSHVLVQFAIILALNGINHKVDKEFRDVSQAKGNGLPLWAVPLHAIFSILAASILTLYFEEPLKNWLLKKIRKC